MNLKSARTILWTLVALAAAGAAYLYVQQGASEPAATAQAEMSLGAPFVLTDQAGRKFDSRSVAGKPHAMFFGFTHCPDVCPNTLARLARLRKALGRGDEAFQIVFVSVDPERDTPAELANYVKLFNTPVEIADVTRSFGIYARKSPTENGDYTMDHSAQVLLFDKDDKFRGTISFDEGDEPALQKLRNITG